MKLNHEHTKYFQQAKTELQTIQQRQYSSTGFSNIRTPYSKSFNAQIEEEEGNSSTVIDRIRILWNELGVVDDFRLLFGLVAEQLDDGNRDDFIRNEIDSLEYLALLLKVKQHYII